MDTEDGMTTLIDVLQLSQPDAQFLLQKYNNDAGRAIQEYLDNPDILKQAQPTRGWDEPPPYHNTDIPGFRIDASDNVASSVRGAAPSRPPSRASYRDEPIDLTAEHRAADPSKSLSYQDREREDREMQEAIALSMGQPPPGQENGITGAGQQFGPARGEYHDTKRWAMTVSKATTREIIENPPPANRQRNPGEPAFLRASDPGRFESLAALLTIYHSIPVAREALLLPKYQQFNYGYDPQWWTGHHIDAPKIVSLDDNGAHQNRDDLLIETQRLMAFLDDTNRSYTSIDALADLQSYNGKEAESELTSFLETWRGGAMMRSRDDPLTQVFSSHGIRHDPNPGSSMVKYFCCLEPMVDPEVDQTFIDILDNIIWNDQMSDRVLEDVWIDKIGDVMTFRLCDPNRKQGKLGVEIPAVWYPDRYMEHFREASRDMRRRKQKIKEELWRLDRSRNSVLSCTPTGRQRIDIKKALSDAVERAPLVLRNQHQPLQGADMSPSPPLSTAEVNDCVKALQDLVKNIDTKVAELEIEKAELGARLRATTAELTKPGDEPSLSPAYKYTLRGVSTKRNISYLLRPASEDSEELEAGNPASGQWQWWRISLCSEDAKNKPPVTYGPSPPPLPSSEHGPSLDASGPFSPWPGSNTQNIPSSSQQNGNVIAYTIRKVNEEDVLKAAREEDDSITLVYASEKAVNFHGSPLSGPLQMFVKADNKMFDNELRGIDQSPESDTVTNVEEMAQLHFSPMNAMQDVLLNDDSDETMNGDSREDSIPTTTTTTTALPARRGADGQPSPKRAKGEDDPPPYHHGNNDTNNQDVPEMQERSGGMGILAAVRPNRIGQHAEKMMNRIEEDAGSDATGAVRGVDPASDQVDR